MLNAPFTALIRRFVFALGLLACVATSYAAPQEEPVKAASNEGEQAIGKFKVAEGLKLELFAAEPMLANPVALRADNKDRVYVIETFRHTSNVLDIRNHMDWLGDDLAARRVEDRINLLKRKMGPNVRHLTDDTDRIRLIWDSKGTGKADNATIFATGFNSIEAGLAASVLPFHGDVYFTDIPSLYLLKDTNGDGVADVRKELSTGYGVHIAFLGHDLHGLCVGPDHKLYFSIGDRGANAKSLIDGSTVDYPDTGAVYRCNLDGSHLEVFAFGLRNPQQLVFDDYGNLFTGDNNPDYGDPARWVYVVEGGDSGWREGYQSARLRRGGGPWMWEELYQTKEKLSVTYIIPPIAHLGAGPSGVAYYPGTGFSDSKWMEHFFMVDFRGGAAQSLVHTFKMEPHGATFELTDHSDFLHGMLATDIDFSPRGGAYVCDWVEGWNKTGKGRIYRIFDPKAEQESIVKEVRTLLADGFDKQSPADLVKLLGHRDIRVRQEAQFALADKGPSAIPIFTAAAQKNDNKLARLHAIWGLGELGEKNPTTFSNLLPLLSDGDSEVRSQAAKVLGEGHFAGAYDGLIKLLADPEPRPKFFAATALRHMGRREATAPLLAMLRTNDDKDAHLRHAAVMGLVGSDDVSALAAAASDPSPAVRMGALLALRRLARPEIAAFLNDKEVRIVSEAAHAINDVPIDGAMPQLGELASKPNLPETVIIRALNANYRRGKPEGARALAAYAANNISIEWLRVEALKMLASWENPSDRDWVMNLYRPIEKRDAAPAREAAGVAIAQILKEGSSTAPKSVRAAAVDAMSKLKINNVAALMEIISDTKQAPEVRAGALSALADGNDPKLPDAIKIALDDKSPKLRQVAILSLTHLPDGTQRLSQILDSGSQTDQQAALEALGATSDAGADPIISKAMDKLLAGQWKPELTVDLYMAAEKRFNSTEVQDKFKKYTNGLGTSDPMARFRMAEVGGDAEEGRHIFRERADASCIRCHVVQKEGGIVGPALDGIGAKQNREYILESIIFPNAKIAPGFESAVIKTKSGKVVMGVVKSETASEVSVMDADGNLIKVAKADITSREKGLSPMPEGYRQALSLKDMRDLVEFLASLKTPASP
ncbi:MAG TPA: HEAT repeat domain-containing protein [Humisphaera sp.]|jgi:quinoprotein glucose dehydrogenase|nr:HEAT repeat domain-containing protein [Humisphaera sp.]